MSSESRERAGLDFLFDDGGQEIGFAQTFTYLPFVNEIAVFWSHGDDDADDGILDVVLRQGLLQQVEWITLPYRAEGSQSAAPAPE